MNAPPIAPAEQLSRLLELVSPRTGLIRNLARRAYSAEDPALPIIYDGELAHFDFRYADSHERGSCGKGLSEETAMLAAIGECIERYCASHPRAKKARRALIGELPGEMIPPTEFVLYSPSQYAKQNFPFRPWQTSQTLLPWLAVEEIAGNGPAWVPTPLLYLNYSGSEPQDLLTRPSSNGFAAGPDLLYAIRAALCETIERDAFMITWLNRLPAREIIDSRSDGVEAMIRRSFARIGVGLRLFLLPTDMPATCVLALAHRSTGRPAAVVGLACDLDPATAVRKALLEICQVHGPFRRKCAEAAGDVLKHYADVVSLSDHAAFFFNPERFNEFDFLFNANHPINLDELPAHGGQSVDADIELLGQAIRAAGSRAFWLDLTTPDLHDYPIRVARVLVTDFQPIHFGYGQERLGGRRLYQLPAKLGLSAESTDEAKLNPCPHPLA